MINITKPVVLGVAASLALGIFAAAPVAHADPVSGSYVAVGSDTLDSSMNGLTNGTKTTNSPVRIVANGATVGSFDAFGSALIQTKPSGPYFQRPSGSGAGVNALIASVQRVNYGAPSINVGGQIDIARSSSGPGSNASATGKLVYVPYARDAVAYAYYPDANNPSDLANLTLAQLKDIYNGVLTTVGNTTVKPLIPQSGSGTRKFFLNTTGVDTSSTPTCPLTICSSSTIPENDATQLTQVGNIIPFSAANWVAQANLVANNTIPASGLVKLGNPDGLVAVTGTAPNLVPGSSLYANTTWGRDTYLVVEYARVNPTSATYDPDLAGLVDSTVATSLTNFGLAPSQPGAVKKKYGFLAPSTTTPQRAYPNI